LFYAIILNEVKDPRISSLLVPGAPSIASFAMDGNVHLQPAQPLPLPLHLSAIIPNSPVVILNAVKDPRICRCLFHAVAGCPIRHPTSVIHPTSPQRPGAPSIASFAMGGNVHLQPAQPLPLPLHLSAIIPNSPVVILNAVKAPAFVVACFTPLLFKPLLVPKLDAHKP
jgi:hypothetical protein